MNTKLITAAILTMLAFLTITALIPAAASQTLPDEQQQPAEVAEIADRISIDTNLVRVSFIEQTAKNAHYEIYEGERAVTDFKLITPADESKVDWAVYLDDGFANQPRSVVTNLRRRLLAAAAKLSNPLIVAGAGFRSVRDVRKFAAVPDAWSVEIVPDAAGSSAFVIINRHFASTVGSRKALLWLTAETAEPLGRKFDQLSENLRDTSVFTLLAFAGIEKKFGAAPRTINYSNFYINAEYGAKNETGLINYHFDIFLYECRRLHAAFFESDSSAGKSSVIAVSRSGRRLQLQSKSYQSAAGTGGAVK